MPPTKTDRRWMHRALELAANGLGAVEPNPMVGCVVTRDGEMVGEGWHQRFGGPHAEVEALHLAGARARGATMYVSLEPCSHFGKTPPCVNAILAAGLTRVVVAEQDPNPQVAGSGLQVLRESGISVEVGLLAESARELNRPFHKFITTGRPWVIAKWAMSLDGKIATRTGDSQWISNAASRAMVHRLRGRVDAILVGRRTAEADNPLLTARPPGPRIATRIVLDSNATLSDESNLVRTLADAPVLVVTSAEAPGEEVDRIRRAGCDVLRLSGANWRDRLPMLLDELGQRGMTNLLVEGGGETLGGFFDQRLVDEVHIFISPRIIGGQSATGPVAGTGAGLLSESLRFSNLRSDNLEGDLYLSGRIVQGANEST